MKKITCLFILFLVAFAGFGQTDTALNRRLGEYVRLNKELNFVRLMDYIHPSLFKLASKEQMIELFEKTYDNDQMKITIESLENKSISGPFAFNGVQYRRVDYYLVMFMKLKNENATSDSNAVNNITASLRKALPKKEISFNAATSQFIIKGMDVLIAIKDDPQANWLFLGYESNNEMVKTLFPSEMVEHFKLQ